MNKESGQGIAEMAFVLALCLIIILVALVWAVSLLDQNGNGILDSKENYELYQE